MPVILALEELTQDYKFQASLSYTVRSSQRMRVVGGKGAEVVAQLTECLPNTRKAPFLSRV